MDNEPTISRLRKLIRDAAKQYQILIEKVLKERGPLIRGSFGMRKRVCGKANCRCTRGELHVSKYLTATDGGKVRQVHIPSSDEVEVSQAVFRYRRFQEAVAKVAKILKEQIALMEEMGRLLLKPYPIENPLPPAKKRGRTMKRGNRNDS